MNDYKGKLHSRYKHGLAGTPLYKKWEGMKRRCLNPNDDSYRRYGGKGITVCNEWLLFANFARDMAHNFRPGLSLDRIDNSRGYSSDNCRWATIAEQAKNKVRVKRYSFQGQTLTTQEWAKVVGFPAPAIYARITRYGWPVEKALTVPVNLGNKYKLHKPLPHGQVA